MPLDGFSNIDLCIAASAPPGAGKIEYAPIDEVDTAAFDLAILQSTYNQQASAGVSTWYTLPHAPGSGTWTEDQSDTEQGPTWKNTVQALMPATSATVRGELNRMARRRYLLRVTRGAEVILIGTPEMPMAFECRFDSGADGGDTRAHRVSFTGVSLFKSPGYVPVF